MRHLDQLSAVIQRNCNISDSLYAGDYGMCVYLLKMREYYRWEKRLPFSEKLPTSKVGDWLTQREELWDELAEQSFECVPLSTNCVDPFDAEAINDELVPEGLVYSAGYGVRSKPHFFLGRLLRTEQYQGYRVLVADNELARDLSAPPAMIQGNTIYVRRESLRRMLWEKVDGWLWNRPDNAMGRALEFYDIDDNLNIALDQLTDAEMDPVILHEIGERIAGQQLDPDWPSLIGELAGTQAEIMARAVRDHIADCSCTWPGLIEDQRASSLHFYFANFTAMRKTLFPKAFAVYEQWVSDGDFKPMRALIGEARKHWCDLADRMLVLYRNDTENLALAVQGLVETEGKL